MDYNFFDTFLEENDQVKVEYKDLEVFSKDEDIDVWARMVFQLDENKYRVTVKQRDLGGRNSYHVRIAESEPLKLENGSNWRKVNEINYASGNNYGFELNLRDFLETETDLEFENLQDRLGK